MVEPETARQVLARLFKQGYTQDFRAEKNQLIALPNNIAFDPEDVVVDKIYRFEGETNLDDEEIIFALSGPKGIKGTFFVAYGPKMDALDVNIVQRLTKKFNSHKNILS